MAAFEVRRDHIEPLWDRVDRNRWQLVVVVMLFMLAATALLTAVVFVFAVVALVVAVGVLELDAAPGVIESLPALLGWLATGCAAGVGVYVARTLTRSERWFAERFGATLTPTGEFLPTKMVLKDMAIATGMDVAPALYLIETPNVNAFVYGRPGRRAIVGVTRGLVERLDAGEQRAVFANLMARLRSGDTIWASGITALMAPLWHVRTAQMTAPDDELTARSARASGRPQSDQERALSEVVDAAAVVPMAVFPAIALGGAFVVLSELLAFGHMRTQFRHSEAADAEGMLLLKDPASMLRTLEKVVRYNNFVPFAGPGMMQLFYAWSSDFSTDDGDDPSNGRIARLREVLGVAGMAPVSAPNEPRFELVPPAPRLGDAALLPATRDPIAVGPLSWWVGVLATALGTMMAIAGFQSGVAEIRPVDLVVGSGGWAAFTAQVAQRETRLLWIVIAIVFLGALVVGRTWSGILGGLFAYTWVAVAIVMLGGAYATPGVEPRRFLGWALLGVLTAGVCGGLLGGAIGRRLVRRSG